MVKLNDYHIVTVSFTLKLFTTVKQQISINFLNILQLIVNLSLSESMMFSYCNRNDSKQYHTT